MVSSNSQIVILPYFIKVSIYNGSEVKKQSKAKQITRFKSEQMRHFTKEDPQMANDQMKRCSKSLIIRKNANQNHNNIPTLYLLGWLLSKTIPTTGPQKITRLGKGKIGTAIPNGNVK